MTVARLALALAFFTAASAHADSKPAAGAKGPEATAMETAYAPGPEHQWLKTNLAGTWATQSTAFMPDGKTMTSAGTAEVKPIHGDRFLVEEFTGTRMGKPLTGSILWGYDNMRKKFESAEIDSMGTGLSAISGTLDDKSKTLTMSGQSWSHGLNKEVTMRVVVRVESDKKHTIELHSPGPDGKEHKHAEIVYTRK